VPVADSRKVVEQRLRLFQIGRVEPLGEPPVNRREKVSGFVAGGSSRANSAARPIWGAEGALEIRVYPDRERAENCTYLFGAGSVVPERGDA
jgi:hypothetical protein